MDTRHVIAAFSEEQTEKLTGITKSQLRYWDNTGFYSPSYTEENRRITFSRVYSFKDIVALRVLNVLRNQFGCSLQHLRDVSARLRALDNNTDRWIDTRLYPLNKRVIWYEPGSELPQEVASGQYVSAVVLNDVVQTTKQAVDNLQGKRTRFGSVEKSRYVMRNAAVISGTRIPVNTIKRFAEAGYTVQQIITEYPDLTEQDVQAAIQYKESSTAA
jgi:uncharacterized protein (DUF433 family)